MGKAAVEAVGETLVMTVGLDVIQGRPLPDAGVRIETIIVAAADWTSIPTYHLPAAGAGQTTTGAARLLLGGLFQSHHVPELLHDGAVGMTATHLQQEDETTHEVDRTRLHHEGREEMGTEMHPSAVIELDP